MRYVVDVEGKFHEERVVEAATEEEARQRALECEYTEVLITEPVEPLEVRSVKESPKSSAPFCMDKSAYRD